jgi:hypothetical protein
MAENRKIMPRLAIGDDDFRSFVLDSDVFVDKTMLIKELLEVGDKVILITRPRRWGKSLNLSMIGRFIELEVDKEGKPIPEAERINSRLFLGGEVYLSKLKPKHLKPLKISRCPEIIDEYQGKFPVIRLSLKEINGGSVELVLEQLKGKIINLFMLYHYLKTSTKLEEESKDKFQRYLIGNFNQVELEESLKFLSGLLYEHFGNEVYILIDEYDAPINSSYLEFGLESKEYKAVLKLFRNLFGSALKTNNYLAKGVITGILRIAKANLLSDLNNLTENSLFDERLSTCYGFTQEEVEALLQQFPISIEPDKIKDWYNGYTFGGQIIYNPWSIMQCLNNYGKLDHYWLDSGGTNIVDHVLISDEVQEDLQRLVAGKSIISEITKHIRFDTLETRVGLYSLLLLSGYLNPKAVSAEDDIYELSIPNQEIAYVYRNRIIEWLKKNISIDKAKYHSFVQLLAQGKLEEFSKELNDMLGTLSFHQTGPTKGELFYNGFMRSAFSFLKSDYIIEDEPEAGDGRADAILISKQGRGKNAIIVEYKVCKKEEDLVKAAAAGLQQIKAKSYKARINQYEYIKEVIELSISFCGKMAETAYESHTSNQTH